MPEYNKSEFIKRERNYVKVSQKKLADGICEIETISRYETGKVIPSDTKFFEIMRKLGKDVRRFYIPNGGNEFINMRVQKINDSIYLENLDYVKKNMEEFLKKSEFTIDELQMIERCKSFIEYETNEINLKEYASRLEKIIQLSSPNYFFGKKLEVKYHSKIEIYLLDDLARIMYELRDYENTKQLMIDLDDYYKCGFLQNERRNMCLSFHLRGKLFRKLREYEMSESVLRKGITMCNEIYRDDYLHYFMAELGKLYCEMGKENSEVLTCKGKLYEKIAEFLKREYC